MYGTVILDILGKKNTLDLPKTPLTVSRILFRGVAHLYATLLIKQKPPAHAVLCHLKPGIRTLQSHHWHSDNILNKTGDYELI